MVRETNPEVARQNLPSRARGETRVRCFTYQVELAVSTSTVCQRQESNLPSQRRLIYSQVAIPVASLAWGDRRDSNPQKTAPQAAALTDSATATVGTGRFELPTSEPQTQPHTACVHSVEASGKGPEGIAAVQAGMLPLRLRARRFASWRAAGHGMKATSSASSPPVPQPLPSKRTFGFTIVLSRFTRSPTAED